MNSNQNDSANKPMLSIDTPYTPDTPDTPYTSDALIITVFEHQRLTSHDFAQDSDFTWLLTQEFAVFSIKRQRGQWQLKVGHYIGLILLPSGLTLEILPKPVGEQGTRQPRNHSDILQTRQWVQRMLSDLTDGNNRKRPNTKNLGQLSNNVAPLPIPAPPLSQWLVAQFLQRLSRYQPIKHYQAQIHNQSSLQGKLLIKEQLRRNSTQPHKFMCETSVLSPDMLSNRLIKSALLLIEAMVQGGLSYGQSKLKHSSFIDNQNINNQNIDNQNIDNQSTENQSADNKNYYKHHASPDHSYAQATLFSAALSPWRQIAALSHHERRSLEQIYQQAKRQLNAQPLQQQQLQSVQQLLDLAYWLLQQSSSDSGSGINTQTLLRQAITPPRLCLLIDMNQAFEQWASQRIARIFSQLDPVYQALYQPQRLWLSDMTGQARLSIRPDLLIYHADVNDAIADNSHICSRVHSHVIDIKWKHLSHSGAISASDAYQLSSYAQAYQAQQVWLVYPVTDNTRQPLALSQQSYLDSGGSDNASYAKLWLMPFNVLTGTPNGWPQQNLDSGLNSDLNNDLNNE